MKICVQTGGVTNHFGIEKGMQIIRDAGFDSIDLNLDHLMRGDEIRAKASTGYFDQSDDALRADTAYIKQAIDAAGLDVYQAHAPFPSRFDFPDAPKTNEYVLRILKKTVMLCGYMNCKNLIVHPIFFGGNSILEPETEHALNIAMYTSLLPEMQKYGITVCLENMFYVRSGKVMAAICSDPHEAAAYIDELNAIAGYDAFAFCFDVGHATLVGVDPLNALRILGKRVRAFHIHDNDGRGDQHMMPYSGVTSWARFLRGVQEIGFEGDLSFETFNACESFPRELTTDVLRLIHATGRYFASAIEG